MLREILKIIRTRGYASLKVIQIELDLEMPVVKGMITTLLDKGKIEEAKDIDCTNFCHMSTTCNCSAEHDPSYYEFYKIA